MSISVNVGFQQTEFILNSELFAAQVTHGGDLVLHNVSVDNMSKHIMFWGAKLAKRYVALAVQNMISITVKAQAWEISKGFLKYITFVNALPVLCLQSAA